MAVQEITEKYFKRLTHISFPDTAIRTLGQTGFQMSNIGFGGYRIQYNSIEHARALRYALLNGINIIDTSSNYTDGGSEMLIGNLLQEMVERKEVQHDEVVVVSKAGYVQGQNMKLARESESTGRPFADMVKISDDCWHCIHPDFLQDQLSRSLERLQMPALDIYLLHNPEYYLSQCKKHNGTDVEFARVEYYRRIQVAFEWMEEKVAEGKIKSYGISSNTFPNPTDDFAFTSLEKILEIAEYVASRNYFHVIQFPLNLYESGACFEKNQVIGEKTLLQFAAEKNIATLTNRPLNAMTKAGMVRLASFRETAPSEIRKKHEKALQKLSVLETQFKSQFLSKAPTEVPEKHFIQVFSLSDQLTTALNVYENWEHWDHVKQNIIVPQVFSYLNYLNQNLPEDVDWKKWSDNYANTLYELLESISRHYENIAQLRSKNIADTLDEANESLQLSETLSQKTLQILTSVPGVQCVLSGMRKTPYVEDALAAIRQLPILNSEEVLGKINENEEHLT